MCPMVKWVTRVVRGVFEQMIFDGFSNLNDSMIQYNFQLGSSQPGLPEAGVMQ